MHYTILMHDVEKTTRCKADVLGTSKHTNKQWINKGKNVLSQKTIRHSKIFNMPIRNYCSDANFFFFFFYRDKEQQTLWMLWKKGVKYETHVRCPWVETAPGWEVYFTASLMIELELLTTFTCINQIANMFHPGPLLRSSYKASLVPHSRTQQQWLIRIP